MQDIEPFYNWQNLYLAEEDEYSPFYGTVHSEFEYSNTIYNYYIHPQWDNIGSQTLYLKVLFVDYDYNFTIIEMIGEWNDAIEDDIMTLKRNLVDKMVKHKVYKFIFIAENVLNFHSGDKDYYEEWYEDIKDDGGWIVLLNLPEQSKHEFQKYRITNYLTLLEVENWRTQQPLLLFQSIDNNMG